VATEKKIFRNVLETRGKRCYHTAQWSSEQLLKWARERESFGELSRSSRTPSRVVMEELPETGVRARLGESAGAA